jgi:predicted nucleic acid-binding protein
MTLDQVITLDIEVYLRLGSGRAVVPEPLGSLIVELLPPAVPTWGSALRRDDPGSSPACTPVGPFTPGTWDSAWPNVYGADMVANAPLADRYEPIIVGRPSFLSFQTVAELRYGALHRNWGDARMRKLDARIAAARVVHSGEELVATYAQLRAECVRLGHALGQREHDADRWIAATALRLDIPLVCNDRIFEGAPGLQLESAHS